GQVDLQPADVADRGAGDGRRLVVGEHDGVLGADPAARRAAALAVVLALHQDAVLRVHAVDAEQAEIQALHAIRAAAVVDHRVPAPPRLLQQLLRRELRLRGRFLLAQVAAQLHHRRLALDPRLQLLLAALAALRGDAAHLLDV